MKHIVLMRHGKSSWEGDFSDKDRPLKKRGINDTNLVAAAFGKYNFLPDVIFSSPANRALSTCKLLIGALNYEEKKLKIVESLYDFGGNNVIDFIKTLPDDYSKVMIFGHNHAFTSIANLFGDIYIANLPTAGLVKMSFDTDTWKSIKDGKTELTIFPRDLKDGFKQSY